MSDSFDVFVLEESIFHCIRDEQITTGTQHEHTLTGLRQNLKQSALNLAVTIAQDAKVVLVHLHRKAIDLFLLIVARVAVGTQRDEIFE